MQIYVCAKQVPDTAANTKVIRLKAEGWSEIAEHETLDEIDF